MGEPTVTRIDQGTYLIDDHEIHSSEARAAVLREIDPHTDGAVTTDVRRAWYAGPEVGFVPGMMSHLPDGREVEVKPVTVVLVALAES